MIEVPHITYFSLFHSFLLDVPYESYMMIMLTIASIRVLAILCTYVRNYDDLI